MRETNRYVSYNGAHAVETVPGPTVGNGTLFQSDISAEHVKKFDLTSALLGGQTHGVGSQKCHPGSPVVPNLELGWSASQNQRIT